MKTETVKYRNRDFKIIEKQDMSKYPNLKKEVPNSEFFFFAEGKRGKVIMGLLLENGNYKILTQ